MSINFLTATPREVIARSLSMHPSAFADAMRESAKMHRAYAGKTMIAQARDAARRAAEAREITADMITDEAIDAIMSDMSLWIPALHEACRLQCAPQFERDIVARHDEQAA